MKYHQGSPPESSSSSSSSSSPKTTMSQVYQELANGLLQKTKILQKQDDCDDDEQPKNRRQRRQQYWVGIAGGPGSGKTTTAHAVRDLLNNAQQMQDEEPSCIVIPFDGFHYPKEKLRQLHGEEGMRRRGAPWTFDFEFCHEKLRQAKEDGEGSFPAYSREISDPVPDGISLCKHHKIVLVEGLYLLYKDHRDWGQLYDLWDETWFVTCPSREVQKRRLVERSLRTWSEEKTKNWGPGEQGATKRAEYNDLKHQDMIRHCQDYADRVIVTV